MEGIEGLYVREEIVGKGGHASQKPVYWEVTLFKGFFLLGSVPVPGALG